MKNARAVKNIAKRVASEAGEVVAKNSDDIAKVVASTADDAARAASNVVDDVARAASTNADDVAKEASRRYERFAKAVELNSGDIPVVKGESVINLGSETHSAKMANMELDLSDEWDNIKSDVERLGGGTDKEGYDAYKKSIEDAKKKVSDAGMKIDDEQASVIAEPSQRVKAQREAFEKQTKIMEEQEKLGNQLRTSTDRDFKNRMYDSRADYQRFSINNEYKQAAEALKGKDYDNPVLQKIKANNQGLRLEDMTKESLNEFRVEALKNAKGDLSFTENMGYYKVPQKAAGAVGTLWLVNKLASSNGEQSNAQLYGQQGY